LWKALQCGCKEVVEDLLATSAINVNVQNSAGETPLLWAAAFGYSEIVQLLLDYSAIPNYTDRDGRSLSIT
jgi:ankyrin repeat protein